MTLFRLQRLTSDEAEARGGFNSHQWIWVLKSPLAAHSCRLYLYSCSRLYNLHALQREHPILSRVSAGALNNGVRVSRQQLAVEAADRCELGRGLCWVRDDLQDVALQRQDENPASLQRERRLHGFPVFIFFAVFHVRLALDEVEAVLCKAKALRRPPLTRDRAAVLPGEREDLQAVVAGVTDVQLVPTHNQLFYIAE